MPLITDLINGNHFMNFDKNLSIKTEKNSQLVFRLLKKNDLKNVLNLMSEIKPMIGGVRYRSFYYVICLEALSDKRVVFAVCEEKSKIVGFRIAIIDLYNWRRSLFYRHPLVGMMVVFTRIFNKILKQTRNRKKIIDKDFKIQAIKEFITTVPTDKSWSDLSPEIAKGLFVGVAESHRGKHVGKQLVQYTNQIMAERGQRRIDGRILMNNVPSIRLHFGLGYEIYKKGNYFFVTKNL
ncbi:MAG: GNAT family N-acetyltransferase [Gillisia sp.]